MSRNSFTPVPWRVNTIGKHWNNPALVHLEVTFGTDGECICDTVYRREDADLIASAPELLVALQQCVEWLDIHSCAGSAESICVEESKLIIAKALGK